MRDLQSTEESKYSIQNIHVIPPFLILMVWPIIHTIVLVIIIIVSHVKVRLTGNPNTPLLQLINTIRFSLSEVLERICDRSLEGTPAIFSAGSRMLLFGG